MPDIEIIKQKHFTESDRAERIARSLEALNQPCSIKLSSQEWRKIAENADLEYDQ